jgi:hypothetical protein
MKSLFCGLAACLLLAISAGVRADEPLVDLAPITEVTPGCDAGSCVAVPGDCAGGACRRPVASAVARAGRAPLAIARRVAERIHRRPLLRRLFFRARHVGGCRR